LRINKSSSDDILYILLPTEQESGLLQIRKYMEMTTDEEKSKTARRKALCKYN
jgi:hypothetical protein